MHLAMNTSRTTSLPTQKIHDQSFIPMKTKRKETGITEGGPPCSPLAPPPPCHVSGVSCLAAAFAAALALFLVLVVPSAQAQKSDDSVSRKKQAMLKEKPSPKDDIMFSASFTEKPDAETAYTSGVLKLFQGELRKNEGVDGKGALYLSENGYAEIENGNIYPREGTIEFWFKPMGDPEGGSHTYLSWGWTKGSDCVFSQGWWEGDGGGAATVFILDNALFAMTSMTSAVSVGRWTHFAVTWNTESNVQIALYKDGVLVGRQKSKAPMPENRAIATPIYLGADLGTMVAKGRRAHGYYNYLMFHACCLSSNEVKRSFLLHAPADVKRDAENPYAWMSDAINKPPREMRDKGGVLLESRMIVDEGSFYLQSKANIDALVDRIARSGFNVVSTFVYHGYGAIYLTDREKMSKRAIDFYDTNPGYDPFAYFVEQAHAKGLEVHSCYTVMLSQPKLNAGKTLFPEFIATKGGSSDIEWYNGYDPRFRDLIVGMMLDHAKVYAIDGINLDFIRIQSGIDTEVAAQEYEKIFGCDLAADKNDPKRVAEFSTYCVNDIVKRMREGLDKLRPGLLLSADTVVKLANEGLAGNGRNPNLWLDKGWLDVAFCMAYGKNLGVSRFDKARTEGKHPAGWVPLLGNYDYDPKIASRDPALLAKLFDYCRRKYNDGNGVALYIYSMLSDEQIAALRAGPFKENAKPSWRRNTGGR